MTTTDSDKRRKEIFGLVVEAYVSTANPVGSELVARKLRSSISPATIRNIMVELEEAGLLEQPHTSAGRVPTDRGYRFYVDAVMEARCLSSHEIHELEGMLPLQEGELDTLLKRSADLLAELTHQAAFVIAPTVKRSTVKQVEVVPLSVRKVLCVLVANEEIMASRVVEISEPMTRDEALTLGRFINTELVGLSFDGLIEALERRMLAEGDSFYHLVKRSFDILSHALAAEPHDRLFLEGASHVISQPEFNRDPRKAQELLHNLLDDEQPLLERVRRDLKNDRVRVRIGHEVQVNGFEDCSYLAAPIGIGEELIGGIGVLGPKRMPYSRLHSLVDGMAQAVTTLLTHWTLR